MLDSKQWTRTLATAASTLFFALGACTEKNPTDATEASYKTRPIEADVIYFVLPDRFANGDPDNDTGGIEGSALDHGFDPTNKGFYHGGDLQGLKDKLGYLKKLGVSAIWLAPPFKNKAVQYHPGGVSAGYHGYWITDFLDIDPHFGTKEDLKQLIEAAHGLNMKVILDIVANHTADVIKYEECHDVENPNGPIAQDANPCAYRPLGEEPYTAFTPKSEIGIKNPEWLNDTRFYNNRGNTHWEGESAVYGDFAGLDDLDALNPQVATGMIDIFKYWISEVRPDGFRIDTVKHMNDSFWQIFVPAIEAHAKAEGIPEFAIFGEVYNLDPKALARFTHEAAMPAVLDFAFQDAARDFISKGAPAQALQTLYAQDSLYSEATSEARRLPTFLGNHDMGRIGHFLSIDQPSDDDQTRFKKHILSHALLLFARGTPVIYYGDEQGFTGDGHDQDARDDMFATKVASYLDNDLIGSSQTTAVDNYNDGSAVFTALQKLIHIRNSNDALKFGEMEIIGTDNPQLFAFTRIYKNHQVFIAINAGDTDIMTATPGGKTGWIDLIGDTGIQGEAQLLVPAHGFTAVKTDLTQAK